jgi:hypothetical protein
MIERQRESRVSHGWNLGVGESVNHLSAIQGLCLLVTFGVGPLLKFERESLARLITSPMRPRIDCLGWGQRRTCDNSNSIGASE